MTNQGKSNIFAFLAVFLWSTVATVFKLTLKELSPEMLLFISSLTSFLFFFVFSVFKGTARYLLKSFRKKSYIYLISGFLNPFFYYLILFKSYSMLPASQAQPLNYTWGIILAFGSSVFLGKKLRPIHYIALLLGFAGVFFIASKGNINIFQSTSITGIFLAIGSAFIWAGFWIFNMRFREENSVKLCLSFFWGTLFILIYIIAGNYFSFESLSIKNILYCVYIGLFEMGVTFLFWHKALQLTENPGFTSNIAYLSPFLSLFFIFLILKENIHYTSLVGLVLITAGLFIQDRGKQREKSN